jgi:hypothetical protein
MLGAVQGTDVPLDGWFDAGAAQAGHWAARVGRDGVTARRHSPGIGAARRHSPRIGRPRLRASVPFAQRRSLSSQKSFTASQITETFAPVGEPAIRG